ncbi:hypothetical protein [Aquisphaera giovannonii]|nr:hypothetical protein [Aquisphaera giovannonii]
MCKGEGRRPVEAGRDGVRGGVGPFGPRPISGAGMVRLMASLAALCACLPSGQAVAGSMSARHAHASGGAALFERLERQNVGVYERMVQMRDAHPSAFDTAHPFYASILTDRGSFEYWLNRWQSHHLRFEHFHPLAWKVIAGEAYMGGPPSPGAPGMPPTTSPSLPPAGQGLDPTGGTPPIPPLPPGGPTIPSGGPTIPPGGPTNPPGGPTNPPGGPTISGAVPEPASCALLASSMAIVIAARVLSRRRARPA